MLNTYAVDPASQKSLSSCQGSRPCWDIFIPSSATFGHLMLLINRFSLPSPSIPQKLHPHRLRRPGGPGVRTRLDLIPRSTTTPICSKTGNTSQATSPLSLCRREVDIPDSSVRSELNVVSDRTKSPLGCRRCRLQQRHDRSTAPTRQGLLRPPNDQDDNSCAPANEGGRRQLGGPATTDQPLRRELLRPDRLDLMHLA